VYDAFYFAKAGTTDYLVKDINYTLEMDWNSRILTFKLNSEIKLL